MSYHIKKDGTPDICRAKPGNCPLGGDENHFPTIEEAQIYADKLNEEQILEEYKNNFLRNFDNKFKEYRNKAIEENQDKIIKLKEKLNLEELPEFLIDEIITGSHEYHHKHPLSALDLLNAHRLMMNELIKENGKFRTKGVGVFAGKKVVHVAPPADLVPKHMDNLILWYETSSVHPLIKSAVFHYEFEFIHPFADGNGRMGRMWHTLLLGKWKKIFFWLPIEELIKEKQEEYYSTLALADKQGNSTVFVEFMLGIIRESLMELRNSENTTDQDSDQVTDQESDQDKKSVEKLLHVLGDDILSAKEIMERLDLVHKPTFRKNYLNPALEIKLIERTIPDKPSSKNQKYRKR